MKIVYDVLGNSENDYDSVEVNSLRWLDTTDLSIETWKDINGYEGLYKVSNYGRVKSLGNKPRYPNRKDIILKQGKNSNYYWVVILYKDGLTRTKKVHRLVAEAFIDNPLNKLVIDHYYPVTKELCNNCLYNLRWVTMKENMQHSIELNRFKKPPLYLKRGKEHCNSKPVIQYDLSNNFIKQWYCMADIKRECNFNRSYINSNCTGKTKTAYGYKWKFGIYEEMKKEGEDAWLK